MLHALSNEVHNIQLSMFGLALDPMVVNIMKDFGYMPTAFI